MKTSRTIAAFAVATLLSPAALLAQEGGGLFSINVGLSIWTVIVFLALLFVLGRYAWGPILGALEAREQGIQGSIDDASRLQDEAASLLEQHRKQLGEARREAQQIIADSKEAATRLGRDLEAKAREESQGIIERARREIERERDSALEAVRRESVDLALAAASKLVGERLDSAADRDLVLGYLSDLSKRDSGAEA